MENEMVAALVVLLREQFDEMRAAGLDCWDDGRSPLEHGERLYCGTADEVSPMGMAYATEPLPVWAKVRKEFESTLRGKLFTKWNDVDWDTDTLEVSYSW